VLLMYTFKVVKEAYGWAVRSRDGMSMPFRQRSTAVREANSVCAALRDHGQSVELIIQDTDPAEATVNPAACVDGYR
jgi:hypothetical protein